MTLISSRSSFRENCLEQQPLEEVLLCHPLVDDCVVLLRKTGSAETELVAYIVSTGQVSEENLRTYLNSHVTLTTLDIQFIFIACLPLTEQGQIDEQALLQLELIAPDLKQQWENALRSHPAIDQVAVVEQPFTETLPPLHLADILSDWKFRSATVATPPVPEPEVLPFATDSSTEKLARPSLQEGELLLENLEHLPTLATVLQRTVQEAPTQGLLYLQPDGSETFQSYPELQKEAERILAGLRQAGVKPQDKVIFQLNHSQDFIPAFWGCMLGGFVPVPISVASHYDPTNSVVNKLQNIWQQLGHPLILSSHNLQAPLLNLATLNLATQSHLEHWRVESIATLRHSDPDPNWYTGQGDDLAVLIFTSGSTGIPKGVMLSHRNILSNVAASAQHNQVTREDISFNWLHLDHVGSLVRCCIRDVYVGCQQIHAPAEMVLEQPLRWLDWVEKYRVTLAWAPNFALGLINAQAETIKQRRWNLAHVRSLLSVAEAIVPTTAQRFAALMAPHGLAATAMHSAWGMTETGAAVTFSHRYLLDLPSDPLPFVAVGYPIPGFKLRIVDAAGQIVEEGKLGFLEIQGAMIACGYYHNPEQDRAAFTEDNWFKTGDLGFLREGQLTVTGRQKDVIIINGLNHYSHEIEAIVEGVAGVEVSYTAACAIRSSDSDTDQLVIFFHTQITDETALIELLKAVRGEIACQLQINPTYLLPVAKDSIPKTAIGKIQRSQLKKQFEAGRFHETLKRIDILTSNANTLPDWFYQKVWCQRETVTLSSRPLTGYALVFLDALGLGQLLCEELGQPCIRVAIGSRFTNRGDEFSLDPKNPDHYRQLLQTLSQTNREITQIVHLWTYAQPKEIACVAELEQAQEMGAYSLLFLVQAINEFQHSQTPAKLFVVSSHTQAVFEQEVIAYENAPLLGLIKTIPKEIPWLDCRHIDLSLEQHQINLAFVSKEMKVLQKQQEVAYRNRQRFVPYLQNVNLRQEQTRTSSLKRGGMYLVSGGLGEIAVEMAKYLLEHYEVQLLLVGRTSLPETTEEINSANDDREIIRRIQALKALNQLPGKVHYAAIDICDLAGLQAIVKQYEYHWGCELDGIIHLARTTQERLLIEESHASFSATLRPKVAGTWVLGQLIQNKPDSLFVHFSSIASSFGAVNIGSYAAANRFVEAFSHSQRTQHSLQSYCFAWSIWDEVGMNRTYQMREVSRARGYYTISSSQGIYSLLAGLQHQPGELLVGLDGSNPYLRQEVKNSTPRSQALSAYFTTSSSVMLDANLAKLEIKDRFGTISYCKFVPLESMALTENGDIDQSQLNGQNFCSEFIAPQTELQHQMAKTWQEVLGLSRVSIRDNFFELGGSSLVAVQLFTQIETRFGKKLPLATLFQASTIEKLAEILQQPDASDNLWSPLVAIQPKGSKPPLFAIHELTGQVLFYRDLAKYLDPEHPLYGLQSLFLNDQTPPTCDCLEEMAAAYVKAIQTIQPHGPYHLIGYSRGGLIAYEMAQQLHRQGQEIAFLGLLDTSSLMYFKDFVFFKEKPFHRKILVHFRKWIRLSFKQKMVYVIESVRDKMGSSADTTYVPTEDEIIEHQIHQHHDRILKSYSPQRYPGRVSFFKAEEEMPGFNGEFLDDFNPYMSWDKLAVGGVDLYMVSGNHMTMCQEPHVQDVAKQLEQCLTCLP